MSNEMRDWQADEIQELQGRIKELEAIIAIRNVRIAPEPLDMERWVQLSHCAVLEAEKTSTPDAPRNPDDTLYYWAFQTLAIQESAITDQQSRIAELEEAAEKYSDNGHFPDCAVNDWTTAYCNCGLAELEALLPGGDHGVVERLG